MDIFALMILGGVAAATAAIGYLLAKTSFTQKQHKLELDISRLQEQLTATSSNHSRLQSEIEKSQQKLQDLEHSLRQKTEALHQSQSTLQSTQTELKALQESKQELAQRLQQQNSSLDTERDVNAKLKDQIAKEGKRAEALESLEKALREQLMQVKSDLSNKNTQIDAQLQRYQALIAEHTELKTTLEQKENHFAQQLSQLEQNKTALSKEFENLANKIFEEKGKTFSSTSQDALTQMLKPFSEQIKSFQERVNQVNDESIKGQTKLESEIRKVLEIGIKMSDEANNLTSALKGDSQKRGAWGEAQLRKTLEMSGLVENTHFEIQSAFKNSEGKSRQTDFLIKLPDDQNIIIDSKVSLVAYDEVVSAPTEQAFHLAMSRHLKAVKGHIDDLASKDYTNVLGMKSPSFVLMFMPIEPAYIEALKHDKGLFEYGYKKGIVLVSHTTLIPILRTVSNLWMIQQSNEQARDISDRAGEIFNNVCLVAERLQKLGNTLGTVSNQYNDTVKAMAGQQGLYGKVERFEKISTKVSKSLPKLETKHSDFETERLALIVEEIQEPEHNPEHNVKALTDDIHLS